MPTYNDAQASAWEQACESPSETEEREAIIAGMMPASDSDGCDEYGNPWVWAMRDDEWHAVSLAEATYPPATNRH